MCALSIPNSDARIKSLDPAVVLIRKVGELHLREKIYLVVLLAKEPLASLTLLREEFIRKVCAWKNCTEYFAQRDIRRAKGGLASFEP